MPSIMDIAERHDLLVIEDACQAIGASFADKPIGSWELSAAFSLHPLKSINVWCDDGVILTRDGELAEQLRLYRNHGLCNPDDAEIFGINSRLDTVQAAVGSRLIQNAERITESRMRVA